MPRLKTKTDVWEDVRGLILQRMEACGYDRTELAARMDCSRQTVSNYLAYPGQMRLDWLRKLCRVLGIPAEKLRQRLPVW